MKGQIAFEALEHVNARYILETAPDVPSGGRGRGRTLRIAAVVAAVLIAAGTTVGTAIWMRRDDPAPPAPPVTESTEMITDTQTEPPTEVETDVQALDWNITTEEYNISEINGICYMNFQDEYQATESDKQACQLMEIYIESFEKFNQALVENTLSINDKIIIQTTFPSNENGIQLLNTEALYQAEVPDGIEVYEIALHGETYDFFMKNQNEDEDMFGSCSLAYTDEASMNVSKDRMYVWYDWEDMTITRQEESTFDGVPCEIVEYQNPTVSYRDIYIETAAEGKAMSIVLRYRLSDSGDDGEPVSATAPWYVQMYCEDNGIFYKLSIFRMKQTPTYDWLTSFGLTPYISTGTGNLATE